MRAGTLVVEHQFDRGRRWRSCRVAFSDRRLAAADVHVLPDAAVGPELRELYLARTRLDAQINRRVGVFDGRGLGKADGAPSTQSLAARAVPAGGAG